MENLLSNEASLSAKNLLAALDSLLSYMSENDTPIDEDELKSLCVRVKSARNGFPLLLEECPAQQINRLGNVLLGPVYTSNDHPWPMDGDGCPMAPLCQLETAKFPQQLEGIDGLVQVWLAQTGGAHGHSLVRVIPAAEADPAALTPVIVYESDIDVLLPEAAAWLKDIHAAVKPSKKQFLTAGAAKSGHASEEELADADWDEWCRLSEEYGDKFGDDVVPCLQIKGYGKPRVYCDITQDQKDAVAGLEKLRKKLEKKADSAEEALISKLTEVGKAYKNWVKVCGDQDYPCLFGTFQEIQYRAVDKDAPFMCFESIGLREWGDGGNAQVFYRKERGFQFDWSCF